MKIIQIRVASRITKSANYQSGAGEAEMTAEVNEDQEDAFDCFKALKTKVIESAEIIADESLARCPRRK